MAGGAVTKVHTPNGVALSARSKLARNGKRESDSHSIFVYQMRNRIVIQLMFVYLLARRYFRLLVGEWPIGWEDEIETVSAVFTATWKFVFEFRFECVMKIEMRTGPSETLQKPRKCSTTLNLCSGTVLNCSIFAVQYFFPTSSYQYSWTMCVW